MIQASNAFKEAVANNKPQRCLFEFQDAIFTNEDVSVSSGGVHYVDTINDDKDLTIGRCPSAMLDFTLFNDENLLNDYEFGVFKASIGAQIETKTYSHRHTVHVKWKEGYEFTSRADGLYLNGSRCSSQPVGTPTVIIIDGDTITTYSRNGGSWQAKIGSTGSLTIQNEPVLNAFMMNKASRWSGRGLCRAGNIVKEYTNGVESTWEYVPLGVFIADRPNVVVRKTIDIVANDLMRRFDEDMPSIAYPVSHADILAAVCNAAGVELGTRDFINAGNVIQNEPSDFKNATMKDVVGWIAEAACAVARIGRDGKLYLKWFEQTGKTIGETETIKYEPCWYQTQAIDKLVVRNYDADEDSEVGSGTNGYIIENNPLMASDSKGRAITDNSEIYNRLNNAPRFNPATIETFGDWTTEAGDVVSIRNDGETKTMPVYKMSMEWAGSPIVKLESTGNKKREAIRTREQRQSYSHSAAGYRRTKELDEYYSAEFYNTNENIGLIAKKTDEHGESLAQIDVQYDTIRQTIQQYGTTLTQIKTTVDGIEMWNKDTEGNLGELVVTAQGINERVQSVSGDVATLKLSAEQFRVKLQGHDGEMSEIRQRQDEISQTVKDADGHIGQLIVKSDSITQRITSVGGQVSELKTTADGLNYRLSVAGEDLALFHIDQEQILQQLRDTDGNIGQLIVKTDSITQRITSVSGQVSELKTTADGLNYRLSVAGEDLALFHIDQEQILQQLRDTDGRVSRIQVTLDGISAMTVDASGRVGQMHSEFGIMKENIGTLNGFKTSAEAKLDQTVSREELSDELGAYTKISAIQDLFVRVGDTSSGLKSFVTTNVYDDEKRNFLTTQAAAEIYINDSKFNTKMGVYGVRDANGNTKTFAKILADQVSIESDMTFMKRLTVGQEWATALYAQTMYAPYMNCDYLGVAEEDFGMCLMKVDGQEVGRVLATGPINFSVADTKKYKDDVAAARRSVTVKSLDVYNENYLTNYKKIEANLDIDLSNGNTEVHLVSVDATDAYNAGYTKGKSEADTKTYFPSGLNVGGVSHDRENYSTTLYTRRSESVARYGQAQAYGNFTLTNTQNRPMYLYYFWSDNANLANYRLAGTATNVTYVPSSYE